ncbi:hypothetical protein TNCV_552141 [Trichonephila clavipes]|nr:hypothetical protein TNCV_552141 [Trichonephila clavipes]
MLWLYRPSSTDSITFCFSEIVKHLYFLKEDVPFLSRDKSTLMIATAGSDVVQSGRPIFDDFFQHLWPYIGNNTENVVFQMAKRLWLIRIDQ